MEELCDLCPVLAAGSEVFVMDENLVGRLCLDDGLLYLAFAYAALKDPQLIHLREFAAVYQRTQNGAPPTFFDYYLQCLKPTHEQATAVLRQLVPIAFQSNFVSLTHWLSIAQNRFAFTKEVFFAAWVSHGICLRCLHQQRRCQYCQPQCFMKEVALDLTPRIVQEISWFAQQNQTISFESMHNDLGFVLLPDRHGLILPLWGCGGREDLSQLPASLRSVEPVFSGACVGYCEHENAR